MSTIYVVRNQHGQYLNRQREWVSGADRSVLYRTAHRDEAVNTVFEASSKDVTLRAEAFACELDERQQPAVPRGPEPVTRHDDAPENSPEPAPAGP